MLPLSSLKGSSTWCHIPEDRNIHPSSFPILQVTIFEEISWPKFPMYCFSPLHRQFYQQKKVSLIEQAEVFSGHHKIIKTNSVSWPMWRAHLVIFYKKEKIQWSHEVLLGNQLCQHVVALVDKPCRFYILVIDTGCPVIGISCMIIRMQMSRLPPSEDGSRCNSGNTVFNF
jgi:hypothetical protein